MTQAMSNPKGSSRVWSFSLLVFSIFSLTFSSGCAFQRWKSQRQPQCVLAPGASKDAVISHLNRNVTGDGMTDRLVAWQSSNARLRMSSAGLPLPPIPASIAVQAPRNFRLVASNPFTGGQEADLGSNSERFWIWSKDRSKEIMTASHEDVGLALQELQFPIHIHPDWLMEVFGVVPINPNEFGMRPSARKDGTVELFASRESPLGEDIERVICVDLCRGCVTEHVLRLPGGKVVARAVLSKHTKLPSGVELPMVMALQWPDAHMQMVVELGNPVINPPNLSQNVAMWQIPQYPGSQVVDIGLIARRSQGMRPGVAPASHVLAKEVTPAPPGRVSLSSAIEPDFDPFQASAPSQPSTQAPLDDAPIWARQR